MSFPPGQTEIELLRSSGLFDEAFYLDAYPDVREIGLDPIVHYLWLGARMGRDPSPQFSTTGYLRTHADVAAAGLNPLVHFAGTGRFEGRHVPIPGDDRAWSASPTRYVPRTSFGPPARRKARMIAFHLPQFHPFAENDAWWGEGFTEWTNVRPARPQFEGHYQPHEPHDDVGYYDLTQRKAFENQISLAKTYGIEGFCFYYYRFAGKRLMERPIEAYLADPSLDLPFCLCWANENWSRRWDGLESEVLIAQEHSAEDDMGCIADLARYMQDPRYIRIGGRPLVLVYRPGLLPDMKATSQRWRKWCRENGIGEIYLAYPQSFEKVDPSVYGFDAAIEFPPNNSGPPDLTDRVRPTHAGFSGKVYDWDIFVERSEAYEDPGYKLFRSVCPGWDNTARRKAAGTSFVNNTPEKYERWLRNAVAETERRTAADDERIIFVNAWNEWAEGAHLEPDKANGYAYLEATRRALSGEPAPPDADRGAPAAVLAPTGNADRRILLVSHDAYRHGAQYLALNLARSLTCDLGFRVDMLVLGDGPMKPEFARWATVHDLAGKDLAGPEVQQLIRSLREKGITSAIVNTLVSAPIMETLAAEGITIVSLVHEMPAVIRQMKLETHAASASARAKHIVFAGEAVQRGFEGIAPLGQEQAVIRPQGLYKANRLRRIPNGIAIARRSLRRKLGLDSEVPVVLGVGYADYRKGPDLFVKAGLELLRHRPDAHFVWLGKHAEAEWMVQVKAPAMAAGMENRFHFLGLIEETDEYYAAADAFALTSREDPFPSVVLEAMDCGIPVVAFAGTGGMSTLIEQSGGSIVPAFDIPAFAGAIDHYLGNAKARSNCFDCGTGLIDLDFSFSRYCHDLVCLAGETLPRVSVIVPNYNYERYIAQRLASITAQTYPIYELIVLDDCSPDDSVSVIRTFLADCPVPHRLVVNATNSGSVFRQWQTGVSLARGDLIWIAEADDLAHPDLLKHTVANFTPSVVMSYCESRQIDENGTVLANDYLYYVDEIDDQKWKQPYCVSGREEIETALFLKNTIPNASAVVFDRKALQAMLNAHGDEIISYRNAGDWVAYIRLLETGDIAFTPLSLNDHRRHGGSVTIGNANRRHLQEIIKVQQDTLARFALPKSSRQTAAAYADRIAKQFGLVAETVKD